MFSEWSGLAFIAAVAVHRQTGNVALAFLPFCSRLRFIVAGMSSCRARAHAEDIVHRIALRFSQADLGVIRGMSSKWCQEPKM